MLFQMCVHQTRGAHTIRTKNSLSIRSIKSYIKLDKENCIYVWYEKHEVKTNIYLLIPCTSLAIPLPSTITTNTIRFDEFSLKTFSLHLPFHRPIDSHGIACNFLTCYVERCSSKDQDSNTDILTDLILTKCVNTLIGNLPDFH